MNTQQQFFLELAELLAKYDVEIAVDQYSAEYQPDLVCYIGSDKVYLHQDGITHYSAGQLAARISEESVHV